MLGLRSGSSESCLGWPNKLKQASRADPIPADFESCNTAFSLRCTKALPFH
jgi:hypothetical protein